MRGEDREMALLGSGDSTLHSTDPVHLLALSRIRGLGTGTLRKLYREYGSLQNIWNVDPRMLLEDMRAARLQKAGSVVGEIKSRKTQLLETADGDLTSLTANDIHIIMADDPRFPERLRNIIDSPGWLFVQGDPEILQRKRAVAIVGTRSPTQEGLDLARVIGSRMVERGFTVVSGLAEGIDAAAHEAVVDAGGFAIAVLGTGILTTFPAATVDLRRRILAMGGAVVTEYFPHVSYNRVQFVERNRIQAGLAGAVIPVQSKGQGGTIHTINFAEAFGRLVIGVTWGAPGPEPQNEIVSLLLSRGHRVVDLKNEEGVLWNLLAELMNDIGPQGTDTEQLRRRKFVAVIREFTRIIARNSIGHDEVQWLLDYLEEVFVEQERTGWQSRQ